MRKDIGARSAGTSGSRSGGHWDEVFGVGTHIGPDMRMVVLMDL